jgi:hypothetical protein
MENAAARLVRLKQGENPGFTLKEEFKNDYPTIEEIEAYKPEEFSNSYKLRHNLIRNIEITGKPANQATVKANARGRMFLVEEAGTKLPEGTHVCTFMFYQKDGVDFLKAIKVRSQLEYGSIHNAILTESDPDIVYSAGEMELTISNTQEITSCRFNLESGSYMRRLIAFFSPATRAQAIENVKTKIIEFLETKGIDEDKISYVDEVLIQNTPLQENEIGNLKRYGYTLKKYAIPPANIKRLRNELIILQGKINIEEQRLKYDSQALPAYAGKYEIMKKSNPKLAEMFNPVKKQAEIDKTIATIAALREELAAKEAEMGEVTVLGGRRKLKKKMKTRKAKKTRRSRNL